MKDPNKDKFSWKASDFKKKKKLKVIKLNVKAAKKSKND